MTAISLHSATDEWTFHKPSRCEVRMQQCVSTKRRPCDFHFANGTISIAPRVAFRWQSSPRSRGTRTRRITPFPNAARRNDSSRRGIRARRRPACASGSSAGPQLMLLQRPTTSEITPSARRISANAAQPRRRSRIEFLRGIRLLLTLRFSHFRLQTKTTCGVEHKAKRGADTRQTIATSAVDRHQWRNAARP